MPHLQHRRKLLTAVCTLGGPGSGGAREGAGRPPGSGGEANPHPPGSYAWGSHEYPEIDSEFKDAKNRAEVNKLKKKWYSKAMDGSIQFGPLDAIIDHHKERTAVEKGVGSRTAEDVANARTRQIQRYIKDRPGHM